MRWWFRRDKPQDKQVPAGETAWSQDAIYNRSDMPKYNPDGLIGKKGAAIYRKMMLDEQVKAVVRFKRDAVSSRQFSFECDRDMLGDDEAARRIAIAELIVQRMKGSFTDNLNGILTSMYQGFSMTEKVFEQFDYMGLTYWGIKELKLRPFDTFEFVVDEHGTTQKVTQSIGDREQDIDISKFIHFTHNPEYDEHYGQSELREAYRSWFSKDMAIRFWNMWLERHASGFKTLQPVNGKTLVAGSQEYNNLQSVLNNSVNGAGMILPSDIELNTVFPTNNVAFKEAMQVHDLGIAKALLVPNLMGITPSGQTGSYSQSDTQLKAFFWTLKADTNRLEETLNEQLFRQLGEINFGDDYWPRLKFQPMSEEQITALVEQWTALLDKQAVTRSDSDEEFVRNLLGFPAKDDTSTIEEPQAAQPAPEEPAALEPEQPASGDIPDETIRGRATVIKAAFTRAEKRVDFTVIANSSQAIEKEHANNIAMSVSDLTELYLADFKEAQPNWDPERTGIEIKKLKLDSGLKSKINRQVRAMFKDGWNLGQKHAEIEVDKAKKLNFSRFMDHERLKFIGDEFFKTKSFKVAGDLTDEVKKKIDTIIVNGAKTGKTVEEIEQEVYSTFASDGLLAEDMMPALAEALAGQDIVNPQARIDTMVRTNLFEAINEARYGYFTDPALDGFVEALEYSAILDSRTTQICTQLDGHVHAAKDELWDTYRPPNHYNCRSLLIPVTEIDRWTESEQPTLQPQKGFG